MLRALFGSTSLPYALRRGLDESMAVHRRIARKIAGEVSSSNQASKAGGTASANPNSLVQDMAHLADTQIRYEAEAKLLRMVYDNLRKSIHG